MASSMNTNLWLGLGVVLLFIATPVAGFGAGDIVDVANIDGNNYLHGDIENTLLELLITAGSNTKFEKLDVKRVYFGNWLRDYSQAIDVGGLKQLPAETIRILLWCLSFLTFGYATGEFEVTAERLGCYRPEEHIDNPKDYADNEDARKYDRRLRAPVDEGKELAVDRETGLKVYIASEKAGIDTSAGLVRRLFEKSIELGRKSKRENNQADFYEALRLLGTGLHCLEDYAAHSNYTELALIELGVDAFPHVGKNTKVDIRGKKIYPLVTGTFGMTDFLHSLVGTAGDKVAESEVVDMESKLDSAATEADENDQTSVLKEILDKVPWDLLEGDGEKPDPSKADGLKEAAARKAEETKQNPLDPNLSLGGVNIEQAKETAQQTLKDMYPILEFHDQVMKGVAALTSKVPGLDDLMENMSGALQIFIFSLLAPYVKPIIAQARVELKASAEGVLHTSEKGQYEVFDDENSSNPTHSMLSKDHFSNVLNPIAGQIACATIKFVVPHIVDSWSDEGKDVRQTIDDILQIFHHPALRDENRQGQKAMFEAVKQWYEGKDDGEKENLKKILSFDGVKAGNNHTGATEQAGHSHGAPVKKKKPEEGGFVPSAQEGASFLDTVASGITGMALEESGLGEKFGLGKKDTGERESSSYGGGRQTESHSQSQYQSQESSSGRQQESSYGQQQETSSYGRNNDNETSSYGGNNEGRSQGRQAQQESSYGGNNDNESSSYGRTQQQSSYGGNNDNETSSYGRQTESSGYGGSRNDDNERRGGNSYGQESETPAYGGGNSYGGGREEQSSFGGGGRGHSGREETQGYGGGREETSGYGGGREESSGYGGGGRGHSGREEREESSGYGGGREESSSYGGGREERSGYGGGGQEEGGYGGGGRGHRRDDDESESRY